MTKKQAEKIVGKIYVNNKLPCGSYTLPCDSCHVGKTLRSNPNSPCAHCYARKGYAKAFAKNVDPFRAFKLKALQHPQWQEAMVTMLKGKPYFRWHDAGDLQSVAHLRQIISLVNATPWCQHWMPTKEFNVVRKFLAEGGTIPTNLTIRLSAYIIDHGCKPKGLTQLTTSTVQRYSAPIGFACPAPNQGGRCDTCRACWSNTVKNVSYYIH